MKNKFSAIYKKHIKIVPGIRSYALAAFFVFLMGIIITLLSWYVDKQRVESQLNARINTQATSLESDIKNRLSIYEQVLQGAKGLHGASDYVSRDEWRTFIQQYELHETYPGFAVIGYLEHLRPDEVPDYTARIQAEGFENFSISPSGSRDEYAPITLIDPMTERGRAFIGLDIFNDPTRKDVLLRARDSGKLEITDRVSLASDKDTAPISSFVTYAAVYENGVKPNTASERRTALQGYVYAGYRANDFFKQAINQNNFNAYSDVRIYDGEDSSKRNLLYASENFDDDPDKLSQTFRMIILDQPWTFQFSGPIQSAAQENQRSNMILIGGTTISFAIAGFLFLVMLTRARALVYSKQNEAQQAKDDLLSLASHQLRTPATAVKQYLGMILEGYTGKINEKQLPAIQKAYASNERQLDTINQILYVAKADAGRLSINKSPFDINLLVDEIVLDLEDMLDSRGQSIIVERSSKKLKVNADEASLRMVIENLISNASKYSYKDSTISIKTGIKNNEIFVSIIDKGVGISPEDHDKLFKKFSRIDNELSLQVGGTGIGLYIDKVLVELHGGRIVVNSEIGKGSTFTIYLPKNTANNLTDDDNHNESV